MAIKAVVFDLDNTLYDYDSCNKLAEKELFRTIAKEFGISEEDAEKLLKKAKNHIKNQLSDEVAASHNRLLYMQNVCEQVGKNPLKYALDFYNAYWDTMLENMGLFEYVKPLLEELKRKHIKIAILTDLTAHIQYRKLESLGISEMIDYLVTSEEAGAEKPSEKMFNLVLKKLELKPEEVLMIGDSVKKDIAGADTVGMKTLLFEKNHDIEIVNYVYALIRTLD